MRVGGARPPPLITFTLTSKVAVYAPAEWADTLTLFHLYQYVYSVVSPASTCQLPDTIAASQLILLYLKGRAGTEKVSPTEYTELKPLLSGVHSVMRVKSVLTGEGGGCTPTPSHYINPHQ